MIGIIAAEVQEVEAILAFMDKYTTENYLGNEYYFGKLNGKKVVITRCGIGKVNSAINTTLLISTYKVTRVINIGSACGLEIDLSEGDIVIADKSVQYDVDVSAFGREIGQVPELPTYFESDPEMLNICKEILEEERSSYRIGLVASGDQFVHTQEQVDMIKSRFNHVMCCEMESASVGQTCYRLKTPFIITRSISDVFGNGDNKMSFDEHLKTASKNSAELCYKLVGKLAQ